MVQRYENESKSQQKTAKDEANKNCFLWFKDTKMKANHNCKCCNSDFNKTVSYGSKILK